ncbi:iron-sulfur cluster repair protein YtfE [Zestomonas carbonaria]|uniref:Iron-sulfur cluster repair protein YtfE n=1 Tax=Zestomonas carbonaria TaxID=2762745 RepID=A0A7U7EMH1_9GAMM|nr:iron-sulfur cluster repair protein YtfE [Pseudomonas carbonaria]CAD5107167.1 Iron-sulfur cluster repair protein YtfE [Pseudomonas carbonaria]
MTEALTERTLSDLACSLPGSTRLFHDYKLDFCCGGQSTLRDAAARRGLDAERIAGELLALRPGNDERDWRQASNRELIEHILERYHDRHREQLPELIRLAARVEKVHGGRADCPQGLAAHLHLMQEELESHMCKEEHVLFPLLGQSVPLFQVQGPIGVMRHEHDEHAASLARLAELTNDLQPPANACNTWRALYAGLEELRRDLMQHIHLENNILFIGANQPS